MLIDKLNSQWQKRLFLIVWLIVIVSSLMQGVAILVENALGAAIPEILMKISFWNIPILITFGWLYYMIESMWFGAIFMTTSVVGVFYWILHSVLRMTFSFWEGLIDFFILGVPALFALYFLIEYVFLKRSNVRLNTIAPIDKD